MAEVSPAAARSGGGNEGVNSSKCGENPIKREVKARADMAESDLAMWHDLLVRQLAGQARPAWGLYNIYIVGKLGSTPTKVETHPKPDGDYMDKNRGKQAKWVSNRYGTKLLYEVTTNSDLDLTRFD